METLGCAEGWLVIFDQRKKTTWKEKLFAKKESIGDMTVMAYGC